MKNETKNESTKNEATQRARRSTTRIASGPAQQQVAGSGAAPIRYSIVPSRPEAHLYEVTCEVDDPDPAGQQFALPAWIPGSYMIREFARHVVSIRAESGRRPVAITKLDKHTWRVAPVQGRLRVVLEVYAWDLSVRGAHLDTSHGFFNGACVFLKVAGQEGRRCEVDILPPKGSRYRGWRVATAMREAGASRYGFGRYAAADYDELIDHPVEMGEFTLATFRACGVPHDIVITGRHEADMARLARDLKRVCEQHIRFFGEPAPMDRYVFLVTAVGEGYGGLEHRASTALLCSRDDLPRSDVKEISETYRGFLGLASHEYFHTWNVKRIKPAAFVPYELENESYTSLLWAFEGVTSYYDDLALVRAGLIPHRRYLDMLARSITSLLRMPGRKKQTVAESSWDAWIKYYRQDENSPNAIVSYYGKGSLVALCLDLYIREHTHGRKSLDDLMQALWREHGLTGRGVEEDGVERLAERVTGLKLGRQFDAWLRSTAELPLARLLAGQGVDVVMRPARNASDAGGAATDSKAGARRTPASLGARVRSEGKDVLLTHVLEGGAAQAAGLSAGDVVVAINGVRPGKNGPDRLVRAQPGTELQLHAFRRDELHEFRVRLQPAPADTVALVVREGAARKLERWLGPAQKAEPRE
jgi:predicted metalloprotease with PDZ domain